MEENLVHQSGNGVHESLGDIDEKVDVMSSIGFDSDELVVSCSSWPEVCLLASRAKVQVTVLAIVGRLILLASLTLQIIGIHRFLLD